ncbi:hypothetical protein CF326_g9304, partial [Tilletia indica]
TVDVAQTLDDVPHGRVVDGGSRTNATATATATDEVAGKVGSDGAMSRAVSSTSTPLRDTSTAMATSVRFIVEAKVLCKLRKGDVFIDYAGILGIHQRREGGSSFPCLQLEQG